MNNRSNLNNKVIEIIGPPGVGKSTLFKCLCREWQPKANWIYQEALLAPAYTKLVTLNKWFTYHLIKKLGKSRIKKIPIELGLRFAHEHLDLVNFYWDLLSDAAVYDNKQTSKKFRSAYFLYAEFCKYQAIYESNPSKFCLINEGLLQKSFLIHSDPAFTKNVISKYITVVPLPYAIIYLDVNNIDIIVQRLKSRDKVIASHLNKNLEELFNDIAAWQYALNTIVEETEKLDTIVLRIDGARSITENVSQIKRFLDAL
jgi:guanylate kinase